MRSPQPSGAFGSIRNGRPRAIPPVGCLQWAMPAHLTWFHLDLGSDLPAALPRDSRVWPLVSGMNLLG